MLAYGAGALCLKILQGPWRRESGAPGCQPQYPSGAQMHVGFQGNQVWVSRKTTLDKVIPRCSGTFLLLNPLPRKRRSRSGNC